MCINKYSSIVCLALLASIGGVFSTEKSELSDLYDKIIKIKTSNTYELHLHNESNHIIPTLGYVESTKTLLEAFRAGNASVNDLNKFDEGLKQYFLTKVNDEEIKALVLAITLMAGIYNWIAGRDNADMIKFNDYSDDTVSFNGVILHSSLASDMRKTKPEVYYEGLGPDNTAKLNITTKTAVATSFTGTAVVDGFTYNFTYNLKDVTPSWYFNLSRDRLRCEYGVAKLKYSTEEFILTSLKSSHKNDALVSDIVRKNFLKILLDSYFMDFMFDVRIMSELVILLGGKEIEFMTAYRKEILSSMVESATVYISSKQLNNFAVTPSLSNSVQAGQTYRDIKVEGLLNFVKYEAINSSTINETLTKPEFSDALELVYPEEGKKQAFITFVSADQTGENFKKFKIKKIIIFTTYTATLEGDHVKVERSRNGSPNNSGFIVKFEFYNFDANNEIIIRNVENFVARAIDDFLSNRI